MLADDIRIDFFGREFAGDRFEAKLADGVDEFRACAVIEREDERDPRIVRRLGDRVAQRFLATLG
jgi:hypothetical protein